jgi:hypothetical protein
MTVFAVITIARQVGGEYIFIKTEKAFTTAGKADGLIQQLKKQYVGLDGQPKPIKISTPQGDAICQCEVGGFELEVVD